MAQKPLRISSFNLAMIAGAILFAGGYGLAAWPGFFR
jgi:hypothetical protein